MPENERNRFENKIRNTNWPSDKKDEVRRGWFTFLLVLGPIAGLIFADPKIVLLGYLFFIMPGVFMEVTPMLFLCGSAVYAVAEVSHWFIGWKKGHILGLAVTGLFLVFLPLALNHGISAQVSKLTSGDKSVNGIIPIPANVTLLTSSGNKCGHLCQSLLYNGAAQSVNAGWYSEKDGKPSALVPYSILRQHKCPDLDSETKQLLYPSVLARIAGGDCLVRTQINALKSSLVLKKWPVMDIWLNNRDHGLMGKIEADRIEVLEVTEGNAPKVLYRKTQVVAQPRSIPFFIFPAANFDRGRMEIFHSKKIYNEFSDEFFNLFGAAVEEPYNPIHPESDIKEVLKSALRKQHQQSDPGFSQFDTFLRSLGHRRNAAMSVEEIDILLRAIADSRIRDFRYLPGIMRASGRNASVFAKPIALRLLNASLPEDTAIVQDLSTAIEMLPEGSGVDISSELKALATRPEFRDTAWRAIKRIRDLGDEAIPIYQQLLGSDWNDAKNVGITVHLSDMPEQIIIPKEAIGRQRSVILEHKGKVISLDEQLKGAEDIRLNAAAKGALCGLCLMGDSAKKIAPDLVKYAQGIQGNPRAKTHFRLAIEVLHHFMRQEEMTQLFGGEIYDRDFVKSKNCQP